MSKLVEAVEALYENCEGPETAAYNDALEKAAALIRQHEAREVYETEIERIIIEAEKEEREGDPGTFSSITRTSHVAYKIRRALTCRAPAMHAALSQIARMRMDGEPGDDGVEFDLTNDDAVDSLHSCIELARAALEGGVT